MSSSPTKQQRAAQQEADFQAACVQAYESLKCIEEQTGAAASAAQQVANVASWHGRGYLGSFGQRGNGLIANVWAERRRQVDELQSVVRTASTGTDVVAVAGRFVSWMELCEPVLRTTFLAFAGAAVRAHTDGNHRAPGMAALANFDAAIARADEETASLKELLLSTGAMSASAAPVEDALPQAPGGVAQALAGLADVHVLGGPATGDIALTMEKMLALCANCKQRPSASAFAFDDSEWCIVVSQYLCSACNTKRALRRHASFQRLLTDALECLASGFHTVANWHDNRGHAAICHNVYSHAKSVVSSRRARAASNEEVPSPLDAAALDTFTQGARGGVLNHGDSFHLQMGQAVANAWSELRQQLV